MTKTEMQTEALDRARNGQSLANYSAIYEGFAAKGIAAGAIEPRVNVLTFNAWKALGRSVKKGEHGVKVVTYVDVTARDPSEAGDDARRSYRKPHTTTVFHISQTEAEADRATRRQAAPAYRGWRNEGGRQVPDAVMPDPGELAADRWNETHS
jgi:hypothetical protein